MYLHDANANKSKVSFLFSLSICSLPNATQLTYAHSLSHTPPQIPSTAGPITKGDWGQTLLSTPQIPDQVSCSTNTTSPLFLCLLIPRIRRHSWVMTEMISPSTTPPPNTSYITSYRSVSRPDQSTALLCYCSFSLTFISTRLFLSFVPFGFTDALGQASHLPKELLLKT